MDQLWLWVGFNAFVLAMLALDLGVFHRSAHEVSVKEAATWSAVWVALALGFNCGIYHFMGEQAGLEFLAGYLIEKALSVDNIFVFVLIFSYFRVPPKYQHRVLFWGILGALVMRGVMIGLGAYLIHHFEWVLYVFGAFLVWTGYRMARQDERAIEPEANPVIRLVRRLVPVTGSYRGPSFFIREPAGSEGATRRRGDAVVRRPRAGGDDGPDLRGGFHPGRLRRHAGSFPRLLVERLRHPRAAGAVLPPEWDHRQVPIPQVRAVGRAHLRRGEDAPGGRLQGPDRPLPGDHRVSSSPPRSSHR